MTTPGLDGIYIGPADLSLAIGETSFDKPEGDPVYDSDYEDFRARKKTR